MLHLIVKNLKALQIATSKSLYEIKIGRTYNGNFAIKDHRQILDASNGEDKPVVMKRYN